MADVREFLVPIRLVRVSALPASPQQGWCVFLTTDNKPYFYDGSGWVAWY